MSGDGKSSTIEITGLLNAVRAGDTRAARQLLTATYQEVRQLADAALQGERPGHTLQPTALANEVMAYFLKGDVLSQLKNRQHYFATLRVAMRHVIIDYERHRHTLKAGGEMERQAMHSTIVAEEDKLPLTPLELLEYLDLLARDHPRACDVVTLRYLQGMEYETIADQLGVSLSTVESDWRLARAWLRRALEKTQ
ncbi:MAG TPA: ECF-type sigma factor [Gemmatales bacterium]|nr:ECF-type sigma factor [Gemmatales bacterium]